METFQEQWENEKLNEENCAAHHLVLLLLTPAVIIKSLLYRAIWMIRNWIQVHKKHLDIKLLFFFFSFFHQQHQEANSLPPSATSFNSVELYQ